MGDSLASLPSTVDSAYHNIIDRIAENGPESEQLVWRILTWIFRCTRPLKMVELQEALSVRPGDSDLFPHYFMSSDDIVEQCESWVSHDIATEVVRFTHFSVHEFLMTNCKDKLLSPTYLAMTCLTYLQFSTFSGGPCTEEKAMKQRLQTYKFSRYASSYWGDHTRGIAEGDASLQCSIFPFLCCKPKRDSMQQLLANEKRSYLSIGFDSTQTMMHLIASQGLRMILSLALERQNSSDVEQKLASMSENELDVNATDTFGHTPLIRGAQNGHGSLVKELLERGAHVNAEGGGYGNALQAASINGHRGVVELLLERGTHINA